MDLTKEILNQLRAPFPVEDVHWKPQTFNGDKTQALAVAYIDARDVMARLDKTVFGNWEFRLTPDGLNMIGALTVCGVTRSDVGSPGGSVEGIMRKASASDALKRSAVMFGIGRYLYRLDATWCSYEENRRRLTQTPTMPRWATPDGYAAEMAGRRPPIPTEPPESDAHLPGDSDDGYDRQSEPDSKPRTRGNTRPFPPNVLRVLVAQKVAKFGAGATMPTRGTVGACVGALDNLFTSQGQSKESATQMRHALAVGLLGEGKAASKTWTDAECKALLAWSQDEVDNAWLPNDDAIKEAALVVQAVENVAGQQPLEGV